MPDFSLSTSPFPASMQAYRPPGANTSSPGDVFPAGMRRALSTPGKDQDRDRDKSGGPAESEHARLAAMHRFDGSRRMLVNHSDQFAARFGAGYNTYWTRSDEAVRDNWTNALAMRRSSFVHEILRHRQLPVVSLPWHIEVDDLKDPDQAAVAERLTQLIDAIPRFAAMRLYLAESIWQGKHGSQVTWGKVEIDGKPGVTVTDHEPVDGDSIVYKFDKTPGILVRSSWMADIPEQDRAFVQPVDRTWLQPTDRALALFLYDQYWRDHFIIQNFEPSSADFMFEGDKAAAIFGVGFRSRLYWDFQLREELRAWRSDALQRIGVNGMLYGFYQSGNVESMRQVINALKLIIRDNVTAFPVEPGQEPQEIRHIEPSQVGYDVIDACISELEDTMRRAVLGQSLSSQAESTGMGSEVADLHRSTFEHILRYDAVNQQETLSRDLLGPMVRFNDWEYRGQVLRGELPFRARLIYSIDKANAKERADVIQVAYNLGLPLDTEAVYNDLGLEPPNDSSSILKKPDAIPGMAPGMGPPGTAGGAGGEPASAPAPVQSPDQTQAQTPAPAPDSTPTPAGFRVVRQPDGTMTIKHRATSPTAATLPQPQVQA